MQETRGNLTDQVTLAEDSVASSKINLKKLNAPGGIGRKGS